MFLYRVKEQHGGCVKRVSTQVNEKRIIGLSVAKFLMRVIIISNLPGDRSTASSNTFAPLNAI
jgi:hypothetical protein